MGYVAGQRLPSATAARPLFGQMLSERVRGMEVVLLWPHDFAESTRATTAREPLAALWRPGFSGALTTSFALNGLERVRAGGSSRWHAQRWFCEPMTRERLLSEMDWDAKHSPSWLRPGRAN